MADVRTTLQDNPTRTLKSVLMRKIHANLSDARSWTNDRWDDGYRRVFGLEMEFRVTRSMNPSSESEESDSSEE